MRFAMNHIAAPKLALPDFFAMARRLGATEVEIRNDLPDVLGSWKPADVKAAAEAAGVTILSINALYPFNVWKGDLPARAEENRLFVAAMKAAGHERIEYLEVEDRDHGTIVSRIPESDDAVARAILAFVKTGRSSRVYYVDDVHGDDGRDGRSRVDAWRSLERVNQASLKPGDTVLFRRGGLWRGQLVPQSGAPGLPITYGAYGMGDKPSLLGSVAMDAAAEWSLVEDGIWSTTDSQGPLAVDVGNIIFDHGAAVGVKKWSRAELQKPWDYFYDSNGKCVLLRSDGNPASLHMETPDNERRPLTAVIVDDESHVRTILRDILASLQATFTPTYILTYGGPYYATMFFPLLIYELSFDFVDYGLASACLLYTSDAADDLLCVDLGGRLLIKKKKKK